MGVFFIYTIYFVLLARSIESYNVTEEAILKLEFTGELNHSDTRSHNAVIICNIHAFGPSWRDFNNESVDPFLCTHFMYRDFEIDSQSNRLVLKTTDSDQSGQWLSKMKRMKKINPSLKAIIELEDYDGIRRVARAQRKGSAFFASVYTFLRENNFDGIFLDGSSPTFEDFSIMPPLLCGLKEQLAKLRKEVGYWVSGSLGDFANYDFKAVNPCVDYFLLYTAFYHTESGYETNYGSQLFKMDGNKNDGIDSAVDMAILMGTPATKLVLTIATEAHVFTLTENRTIGEDKRYCCGIGQPSSPGAKFTEFMKKDDEREYLTPEELCKLKYNSKRWTIFRSISLGKEVFMTNGKRWMSFDDFDSLKAKVMFAAERNLAGILLWSQFNQEGKICNSKTGESGPQFAFTHQLNYLVYQYFKRNEEKIMDKTIIKEITDATQKGCELVSELRKFEIPQHEYDIWICMAREGSQFDRRYLQTSTPSTDQEGCSTTKYGIFGLFSPICRNPIALGPSCLESICDESCEALRNENIHGSISCLMKAFKSPLAIYPSSWSFCSDSSNRYEFNVTDCPTAEKLSTNGYVLAIGLLFILVVLSFSILGFAAYKLRGRLRNAASILMNRKLTYEEIKLFRYGISRKRSGKKESGIELTNIEDIATGPYDKSYEVPAGQYSINRNITIGSGAYGVVHKAIVMNKTAAAKTLKPFAEKEYILALLAEIKIMCYLGKHANIVEFLGSCTQHLSQGVVYVFLEYCDLGSLERYLRENRKDFGESNSRMSKQDLVSWSLQIANGMMHLANKNVIHSDLSTRNVLLTADRTVKVSDFGLSRKLYTYTNYIKSKQEPLPWRWMSVEALRELNFSTESDVWAFGITMWEIFSLGTIPYPGINYSLGFVDQLAEFGLRPLKPKYADDFIFQNIMVPTWNGRPENRPSFFILHQRLQNVMHKEYDVQYENITEINHAEQNNP